jgi:hypothetical protein
VSRVIWKYSKPAGELSGLDVWKFSVPQYEKILTAKNQDGNLAVWIDVDPSEDMQEITLLVIGTGVPFPEWTEDSDERTFIGTVQFPALGLVFHVFEVFDAPDEG